MVSTLRLWEKRVTLLTVPVLFDLAASSLMNIGLLFVTASGAAMLRQSLLLFAAGLMVGLRQLRPSGLHAAGLAACMVSDGVEE
jgi:hypothetical protein